MLFKTGDIFWADMSNRGVINGSRPVIILENISDDSVKIVPISSNTQFTNKRHIVVNLLLSDKISYVSILLDKVAIISKKCLSSQIGSVKKDTMQMLIARLSSPDILAIDGMNTESSNSSEITIFPQSIEDMKPYIIDSNKILKDMISQKSLMVNIFIAIITGIVASLITNCIWMVIVSK